MSGNALQIEGVTAGYGDLMILRDISFSLPQGNVVCVTGKNGVGKTTLMRLVTGILQPTIGRVIMQDEDISTWPSHKRQIKGLTYAPQDHVTFEPLSVRENLTLHRRSHDLGPYEDLFGQFPIISERLDQKAGTLSGGERKILSFCRAMAEGGRIVCLDEPTEGVQPENINRMANEIRAEAARGTAFLVVEQNLSLVEAIADHVIVLDHGEMAYQRAAGDNLREDVLAFLRV